MKRMSVWAPLLAMSLVACHHQVDAGDPVAVTPTDESEAAPTRVYIEAVMLLIPRGDLKTLRPVVPDLASRTDGAVMSAPHVLLEVGRPTAVNAPVDRSEPTRFTWKFDAAVTDDGKVRLGIGVTQVKPAGEATTTLVLNDGQVVILPTLLPAPEEQALVVVLQPRIIRTDQDLERILEEKRAHADAASSEYPR